MSITAICLWVRRWKQPILHGKSRKVFGVWTNQSDNYVWPNHS
jgi:hypothetical protein